MLVRLNSEHWCHKIFILLQKNARSLADFQILITNLHIENTQSSQARRVGIFTLKILIPQTKSVQILLITFLCVW